MNRGPRPFPIPSLLLASALGLASGASALAAARIDPALARFARAPEESAAPARVIALLSVSGLSQARPPRRYDRRGMNHYLRRSAQFAWKRTEESLRIAGAIPTVVKPRALFWVNNSVSLDVTPAGLKALVGADGVDAIFLNKPMGRDPVLRGQSISSTVDGGEGAYPYAFVDTGLDQVIARYPRATGRGVVIGSVDTGADGTHPALKGKIAAFFDASTGKPGGIAKDYLDHGTHTAGTMVGGNRTTHLIGMAPEARLIQVAGMNSGPAAETAYDATLSGMQFLLDPDDNPATPDQPRAINNSWNAVDAPDLELFYRAISAWEAAGILPVFSAGNSGPAPRTISPPHEHPLAFSVGYTGKDGRIMEHSSRGPGIFHGRKTLKPDLTAPGEKIRSSIPDRQYAEMSGSSMAAPHVTGAAALIFQADPNLNPQQVREILLRSATPTTLTGARGTPGQWNPVYGYGKSNFLAALQLALGVSQAARPAPSFLSDLGGGLRWMETAENRVAREIAQAAPLPVTVEELFATDLDGALGGWPTAAELF